MLQVSSTCYRSYHVCNNNFSDSTSDFWWVRTSHRPIQRFRKEEKELRTVLMIYAIL